MKCIFISNFYNHHISDFCDSAEEAILRYVGGEHDIVIMDLYFDDGELKSGCFYTDGTPKETIAVCVIKSIFDDLLNEEQDYTQSYPYEKMANMLIASIGKYKRGSSTVLAPQDWSILQCIHVDFSNKKYTAFAAQIAEDLKSIFSQVKRNIDDEKNISTTNGKYIQIRSKDSGGNNNHPIYSKYANRYVSHCNYAIYITKNGIDEILRIEEENYAS